MGPGENYLEDDDDITFQAVTALVRMGFTEEGAVRWWQRPHPWLLEGLSPNEAWVLGRRREVYDAAYALTDMTAT